MEQRQKKRSIEEKDESGEALYIIPEQWDSNKIIKLEPNVCVEEEPQMTLNPNDFIDIGPVKIEEDMINETLEMDSEESQQRLQQPINKLLSKAINWKKESVLHLIEQYEKLPILYNPKDVLYKNKHARVAAIETVTRSLRDFIPNITGTDIKLKLHSLRGQFTSELKKLKQNNLSGIPPDEKLEPYWFHKLTFLREHVKEKPPKSYYITDNEDVEEDMDDNSSASVMINPKRNVAKKFKAEKNEDETDKLLATTLAAINNVVGNNKPHYSNEVNTFGEHVKAELATIDDLNQQADLRHQIINVIYNFKRNNRKT